jgi:HTH-type transcriptional regulator, cell division transcriptional repressor
VAAHRATFHNIGVPKKSKLERLLSQVGANIQEIRLTKKMSQEKVAEAADLNRRYLQRLEAGDRNFTMKTLVKIAHALKVKPGTFFD